MLARRQRLSSRRRRRRLTIGRCCFMAHRDVTELCVAYHSIAILCEDRGIYWCMHSNEEMLKQS